MACNESGDPCNCPGGTRRSFLKLTGVAAVTALTGRGAADQTPAAGPNSLGLIPADKHLDPAWLHSLTGRGQRETYTGKDLALIGMPVGGACAGQLYLGGDGKLWRWDIFNQHIGTGDAHYAHPPRPDYPIDQGFAIRITQGGKSQVRALDKTGFSDVRFTGEYPIGFVTYADDQCPVSASLEAFSPFIPLNTFDSSLPATLIEFTLANRSRDRVEIELAGWMQNGVCLYSGKQSAGRRKNVMTTLAGTGDMLLCSAEPERPDDQSLRAKPDWGTMGLVLLGAGEGNLFSARLPEGAAPAVIWKDAATFQRRSEPNKPDKAGRETSELRISSGIATTTLDGLLRGALGRRLSLAPGARETVTFVMAWCFPNLPHPADKNMTSGNYYAKHFADATAVARYVADNFERLARDTRLWHETWYDSTLPYWALNRTFLNTSIVATSTCRRWRSGRFWCWEGVGCCIGTCTHVWHYAHAVARLFPDLERSTREIQDLDTGFDAATGSIGMRGEFERLSATDGQTGTILRLYREHQMSADDDFLNRNWPRIRKASEFLVQQDGNDDGILEGNQPNTLDTSYFGPNAMISSLYVASVRAAEQMAREVGDIEFAQRLQRIVEKGSERISTLLWNGEYFIQIPDPNHPDALKTGDGCFIDQVFGQSWAWQVGLGRILPRDKTISALRALWKYNFAPDVGPFRAVHKPGRWYAMPGEAGLIMCSWPRGGYEHSKGKVNPTFSGYLNECMNGFEYQAAGHMIWEGLLIQGLAVTRALHDRYHPSKRNPWNEIECGDHYARSMASYGVYLALCGYEHHGPAGHLGFAPRITPEDFRAAFTTAQGWGTFEQKRDANGQRDTIHLQWGRLRIRTLRFEVSPSFRASSVTIMVDRKPFPATHTVDRESIRISLPEDAELRSGQALEVTIR